ILLLALLVGTAAGQRAVAVRSARGGRNVDWRPRDNESSYLVTKTPGEDRFLWTSGMVVLPVYVGVQANAEWDGEARAALDDFMNELKHSTWWNTVKKARNVDLLTLDDMDVSASVHDRNLRAEVVPLLDGYGAALTQLS